jgi:hypothetical protein
MEKSAILLQIPVTAFAIALQFEIDLLATDVEDPFRLALIVVSATVLFLITLCTLKSPYVLYAGATVTVTWYASQVAGLLIAIVVAVSAFVVLLFLSYDKTRLIQWSIVLATLSLLAGTVALNLLYLHTKELTELTTTEMYEGLSACLLLIAVHAIGVFTQRLATDTTLYSTI